MYSLLMFAQETAEQVAPDAAPRPWLERNSLPLMLAIFGLFYFIVILPMNRRRKSEAEQQLANSLVPGTKVVTNSGIVGTIVKAKEGEADIVIRSEDTKLRILRSTIAQVLGNDNEPKA